jgi:eukaryotic-like serine/threonine-protein kinase
MPKDPRVAQLLEEILESDQTPEEACRNCPELLPIVRQRLRQIVLIDGEIDALMPEEGQDPLDTRDFRRTTDGRMPRVSGYEIESVLGRGGMGVVYKTRQLSLGRTVALKMLLAGPYASPQERLRFRHEAEAIAALRHPNIVQVHDVGEYEGRLYFTMEFVEGGSLAQKSQGTPQPAREAATLVATLARAVHAAHQAGIVHRDLKPGNVLLTADGTPKLSDFGLAKRLEGDGELTLSGAALGTPSYMAPEQAQGRARTAERSLDVYSLGAILYELLTGRPPFRAATNAETLRQVIFEDPVPPSRLNASVPRDVETICLKCLQKAPSQRYAGAEALAEDLDHFLRGESITARPDGRLQRMVRRIRRQPLFSAVVAASTLLALAFVGGALWLFSQRAAGERAAEEDLQEMARSAEASRWPEARAALERAKVRTANGASARMLGRIDHSFRDLQLVSRLDKIRLGRRDRAGDSNTHADEFYEKAFVEAGLGGVTDDPAEVAARIRPLAIRNGLVAALDDWALCFHSIGQDNPVLKHRAGWVLEVARQSDSDPSGWRIRARDPKNWDAKSLLELTASAPIKDTSVSLLLAHANRLEQAGQDPCPFLTNVQKQHADDFWANFVLGNKLREREQWANSIRYYQAALSIRPQTSDVHNNLGLALMQIGQLDDAADHLDKAVELDPGNTAAFGNVGVIWRLQGRDVEAIKRLEQATGRTPEFAVFHAQLAFVLAKTNRFEEALSHYRRALDLAGKGPSVQPSLQLRNVMRDARRYLNSILISKGRFEEARSFWAESLQPPPGEHDAWYGYAELCLFLGQEEEYRRVRRIMLDLFGNSSDPKIAERTGRACLLRQPTPDELRVSVALAERALSSHEFQDQFLRRHFLFLRGLGEYRQGRFDAALATMLGPASGAALGPTPQLVKAMALCKLGREAEAKNTLAAAIESDDWRRERAVGQDGWICHILRREAEAMIFPNLPAFLDGKYQPRDYDERIAFLGVCEFTNRTEAAAQLYAEAFAADPAFANDVDRSRRLKKPSHRLKAARMAALAACGRGTDAATLSESRRKHWREQARQWLRADLAAWAKLLDTKPESGEIARATLSAWQSGADLANLREPAALSKFDDAERKDCLALWNEVALLLKRIRVSN